MIMTSNSMRALALGPYIGGLGQELLTFRPYAKWLCSIMEYDEVFLSTHYDKLFLYKDFIKFENLIPVDKKYSVDINGQKGFIHDSVNLRSYNKLQRKFKNNITEYGYKKKDIDNQSIKYRKTIIQYPIHKKIFTAIEVEKDDRYKDFFFYIPYGLADMDINGDNVIRYNPLCSLKETIVIMSSCRGVITPISFWTLVANLQNVPVFSWGKGVSVFRSGGMYNLDNDKCITIPEEENKELLMNSINGFIENS